jgi:hypothetical protein
VVAGSVAWAALLSVLLVPVVVIDSGHSAVVIFRAGRIVVAWLRGRVLGRIPAVIVVRVMAGRNPGAGWRRCGPGRVVRGRVVRGE